MSTTTSHLDNVQIRIGILAAHPVVVAGLKLMLSDGNLIVTHEASTVDEAVSTMSNDHPDVAILDPDSNDVTLHAITQLNEAGLSRVLVFTTVTDPKVHRLAFELGALGVVLKDQPAETLVRAIRKIHAGEAWLERVQTANLLNAIRRRRDPEEAKIDSLTKREREVIKMVTLGLNGAAIGERLFISEATVRNHLTSILGKLELANRFELAVYAFRHRLVEVQPSESMNVQVTEDARDARAKRAVGI
jgi:two-component system, NarL family, nitrate/nitrite response regulator NarL